MSTSPTTQASSLQGANPKLADSAAHLHDLIASRWSPRAFSGKEVNPEDLKSVLEAARWAASSYNEQPWRFLVATKADPAAFEKFLSFLVPVNRDWAKSAPVLIITAAKKTFSHDNSPNHYGLHDAGAALANLFLQANALGLYAHGMGGFDHDKARKELGIPDGYEVGAAVALGYAGSADQLSGRYREVELAPRQRKPLKEIAFGASWNSPLGL